MNPGPDSRADEFDEAVERRRSGDNTPIDDREMQELVDLASRLEQALPDDIPDPAFRENLKIQLLQGSLQPGGSVAPDKEPVSLEDERWHRRVLASPWRLSAAAAACMVVLVVAFMTTANPFGTGSSDNSEEVTSFRPVDADDSAEVDDSFPNSEFALGADDNASRTEEWLASTFPPLDVEHVVLPPLMVGFMPFAEREKPQVELLGLTRVADVDMPSTATVYYLNTPSDGTTMLTVLKSLLEVDGELVESNGAGEPYRIVDENQEEIVRWDPASAFFHFRGGAVGQPLNDLIEQEASPGEVAQRFLELIGFDLYNIEYESRLFQHDSITEVQFRPRGFPETGMEVTLGGSVYVDDDGSVQEAQLYWLSLIDHQEVALRDPDEILTDIEDDYGFAPPAPEDVDEMMIDVEEMKLVHVLTRMGESEFVLQPAVKVVGAYGNGASSMLPGPARYFVAAVENGN